VATNLQQQHYLNQQITRLQAPPGTAPHGQDLPDPG